MPNGFTATNITTALSAADAAAYAASPTPRWIFSMLNLKYMDWSDPYILQTYAEVQLMAAEAAVLGWVTSDAATHFKNGVEAAINNWRGFDASFARTQAEIDAYVAGREFAAASNADKLRLIGEEYWAATFLNDIESWSNWRRTGFPVLTPAPDAVNTSRQIPRRYTYGTTSYATNTA